MLRRCRFGGGCVNDTIMHLPTPALPFGGMAESGMGAYHGRWSFEEFSHREASSAASPANRLCGTGR